MNSTELATTLAAAPIGADGLFSLLPVLVMLQPPIAQQLVQGSGLQLAEVTP